MISTRLLFCLCLLSGFSSLVLETLWTRLLSLSVGSTSAALSLALAIFFLGLAAGSFWIGQKIHDIKNPFRFYGWLEALVGVSSLPICVAFFNFSQMLSALGVNNSLSAAGIIAKFAIVFFLLIIPTMAMGATLPLLSRAYLSTSTYCDKKIAQLYGVNTLGAFLGAVSASFLLIPALGIMGSAAVVLFLNLSIFALTRTAQLNLADRSLPTLSISTPLRFRGLKLWILLSTALVGYASISAEIVWNKYLSIFFGTNIYGLGLTLGLFLLGIGCGSLLLAKILPRVQKRLAVYSALLATSALALLLTSHLLDFAPWLAISMALIFNGFFSLLIFKSFVAILLLIVPTCLFGALFPFAVALLGETSEDATRAVGTAYAVNTLGAILASTLTGIWLIPSLGSATSIRTAYLVLVLASLPLMLKSWPRTKVFAVTLFLLVLSAVPGALNYTNIIKSAYTQQIPIGADRQSSLAVFAPHYEDFQMIIEGESSVISLSHDTQDGPNNQRYLRLKSNGLNESVYDTENLSALPKYEALLGFLPHLFVRNPKNAFVIGYGGGCTADYLTRSSLKEVHVVELERGVLKAANYVYKHANPILERENLRLQIEDARFVLARAPDASYDMILSQPSHSWLSGAANLFTEDFFRIVQRKLRPHGIFSQWLNLYNIDETVLKSILRTFYTVFPYGAVFSDYGDTQMIMLGANSPLNLSLQKLKLMSENPIFRQQLVFVPLNSPYDILSTFSLGRTPIMKLTEGARLNTDNNVYAETRQSRIFYSRGDFESDGQNFLRSRFNGDYSDLNLAAGLNLDQQEALMASLLQNQKFDKFQIILAQYEAAARATPERRLNLARLLMQAERWASAQAVVESSLNEKPSSEALNLNLRILAAAQRSKDMQRLFARHKKWANRQSQCLMLVTQNVARDPRAYEHDCGVFYHKLLGLHYLHQGKLSDAQQSLERYLRDVPHDLDALNRLQQMSDALTAAAPTSTEASANERAQLATRLEAEKSRRLELATYYKKLGLEADAQWLENTARH